MANFHDSSREGADVMPEICEGAVSEDLVGIAVLSVH